MNSTQATLSSIFSSGRAQEPGFPPAIALLCLCLALLLSGCTELSQRSSFDAILDAAIEEGLPGVVLIVDAPEVGRSFKSAVGVANRAEQTPMTTDAGFRIASNSKAYVALALAVLHVDGVLDLDSPLSTLVDPRDLAGIVNAERATLRQVLNHTSRIPDYLDAEGFWDEVERGRQQPWSIRDALVYARDLRAPRRFEGDWVYSNTNYLLAGLALEQATGLSWAEALRSLVLDPLGLGLTFVENGEEPRLTIIDGYSRGQRSMRNVDTGYGLPDGGVVAPADELVTFVRAVGGGADLNARLRSAVDELLTGAVRLPGEGRYGLGLAEFTTACGRTIGHGGTLEGYLSEMFYVPKRDLAIVIMANASDGRMDLVFDDLVEATLQQACGANE